MDIEALEQFRADVDQVARVRDLATATDYGARLNRLLSPFDRATLNFSGKQRLLMEMARSHVRAMMNCPRRMRLDTTWQDDFVIEARKAADVLISLATSLDSETTRN